MENVQRIIKTCFIGDTSITGIFAEKILENGDVFDHQLTHLFKKQDFVVCNFEGPATNEVNCLRKDIRVVSPPISIRYLSHRNFNVFNLANNHVFDCGILGFVDTKKAIKKNNLYYFGAGETINEAARILYLHKNDITIALIGVSHKEGSLATKQNPGVFYEGHVSVIKDRIRLARANADWVILNYHGGEEFTRIPMPRRRRLFRKLLSLDVDLLIAHHPHVFQGYERINGKTIFYSLGNFIFDIGAHRGIEFLNRSAVLQIEFTKKSYRFRFLPIEIDVDSGYVRSSDKTFISDIKLISDFEQYRSRWLEDANRVFLLWSKRKGSLSGVNKSPASIRESLGMKILRVIVSPATYISIWKIMRKPNRRPILVGWIVFNLLRALNMSKRTYSR